MKKNIKVLLGDWGLGIGDWGLGQSPIPNPPSPINNFITYTQPSCKYTFNLFKLIQRLKNLKVI